MSFVQQKQMEFSKILSGLVGGHCMGVDPYYLAYKSKNWGINLK